MTDRTPENFHPPPVQEEGEPNMTAALKLLTDLLQKNPDVITYIQTLGREPAKRSGMRPITDDSVAVTCESYSWAMRFLEFLWTALKSVFNVKGEIQAEKLTELENMNKTQEKVNTKQGKVLHESEKMEDKIKIAQESDYRIARKEENELETGLINATCNLDECQEVLKDLKAKFSELHQGAKEAVDVKQMALIIVLVFAAALTAGCFAVTYQLQGRVDTSVGLVIVTAIQLLICRWRVRVYFGNQMLVTKYEEFRNNELQKAEDLQKQLKRDVEKRLPALKAQLAVLDIDVSLYASLRPHSE